MRLYLLFASLFTHCSTLYIIGNFVIGISYSTLPKSPTNLNINVHGKFLKLRAKINPESAIRINAQSPGPFFVRVDFPRV
jgi:hypothetical protein